MRKKTKELLVIVVLLNLAAAGWYGFLLLEVKTSNENFSRFSELIETATAEGNTVHAKKELAANTGSLREKLESRLIAKEGAVDFIELLERVGNDVGARVSIESVSASEVAGASFAEELRLAFTATGSWGAVTRFIGLLEFLPYRASIQHVTIAQGGEGNEKAWRARVSLSVLKEK